MSSLKFERCISLAENVIVGMEISYRLICTVRSSKGIFLSEEVQQSFCELSRSVIHIIKQSLGIINFAERLKSSSCTKEYQLIEKMIMQCTLVWESLLVLHKTLFDRVKPQIAFFQMLLSEHALLQKLDELAYALEHRYSLSGDLSDFKSQLSTLLCACMILGDYIGKQGGSLLGGLSAVDPVPSSTLSSRVWNYVRYVESSSEVSFMNSVMCCLLRDVLCVHVDGESRTILQQC
jgi:hypothetical protein